jgi:hypothetical protein
MCKTCEYCNNKLTSKWVDKTTRFCSRTCSNLARKSTDFYKTHSKILKEKYKKEGTWGSLGNNNSKTRVYKTKSLVEKVEGKNFDDVSWDYKRIMIILDQKNKCNKCNLDEWLGSKIPLEIDHIDGDSKNDLRDNLEALCPNCHAQTTTFRGRNEIKSKFPPSNVFYEKYKELGNIRQTLLFFELAAKGNNYTVAKKMISKEDYNISFETELEYIKI